jgi:hypothetical protein
MRKLTHAAARSALQALLWISLAAGASAPDAPTLIVVVPDGYALLGTSAANSGELLKLLMDRKITSVDLRTEGSNDYEKIGRAIYAFQRWGIDLVHIDDRDVKALVAAERRTADPAERTVPPTRADADK